MNNSNRTRTQVKPPAVLFTVPAIRSTKKRTDLEKRAAQMRERFSQHPLTIPQAPHRVRQVIETVCAFYDLSPRSLSRWGKQSAAITEARRSVVVALRELGLSFTLIGRYTGLHHTSVMYLWKNRKCPARERAQAANLGECPEERQKQERKEVGSEVWVDLSGEWAI